MIVHLDFETRSRADLTAVGAHRYGIDPTTEILMCAVSGANPGDPIYLWVNPDHGDPVQNREAEDLLDRATLLYAHNAPFEQAIVWGTHERRATSPFKRVPDLSQWRCTAALARKAGLPPSLEKCAEALELEHQKDRAGKALIKFFSVPDAKTGQFNRPQDHPEKWSAFCGYCRQDVRVEKAIHVKLKPFDLTGLALETFQFTLRMNQLGVPVNVQALRNAQRIIDEVESTVTKEFVALTQLQPTQREAVREWLGQHGITVENMQADTLDTVPVSDTPAYRALSLYRKLSYAAVKKVSTMLDWACPDARLRGVFTYHGAGTGRWSAGGPQLQNVKKATPEIRPITPTAYAAIIKGIDAEGLDLIYGEPYEIISCCARHFVHHEQELLDGDYNAIEARVACWLSKQEDAVQEYRAWDTAPKELQWITSRYVIMAADIYGKSPSHVTSDEREVGKRAILGLGYGMGVEKFKRSSLEQYGMDLSLDLCERAKTAFRQKHRKMVAYWYQLDDWMRNAIKLPGTAFGPFVVRPISGVPYMLGRLPSGRSLAYPRPKIEFPVGDTRDQVTYWGQLPMSQQWGRIKLYGAKCFENFCQAIAADVMAHGAMQAERDGMPPFALIHDQGLAIRHPSKTADDFARSLATLPPWAAGLPLKVEAQVAPFYRK